MTLEQMAEVVQKVRALGPLPLRRRVAMSRASWDHLRTNIPAAEGDLVCVHSWAIDVRIDDSLPFGKIDFDPKSVDDRPNSTDDHLTRG